MCNAYNHPDWCTCGFGGDGHRGRGWVMLGQPTPPVTIPARCTWRLDDDFCAPSRCKYCDAEVYFVRHNGGCVWVAPPLGWPWPKHHCFYDDPHPSWIDYFAKAAAEVPAGADSGIVVEARFWSADAHGPSRVLLAIDGGPGRRRCVAVAAHASAEFHRGSLVIVDDARRRVISSKHDSYPLLDIPVSPVQFGLAPNWTRSAAET